MASDMRRYRFDREQQLVESITRQLLDAKAAIDREAAGIDWPKPNDDEKGG